MSATAPQNTANQIEEVRNQLTEQLKNLEAQERDAQTKVAQLRDERMFITGQLAMLQRIVPANA